jgi:uncharacterized protein (UPF0332 family)
VWLASARHLLEESGLPRARFTVAIAQAIHAVIRGNDALTVRFLGRRSTRHEDAIVLFRDLVRSRRISPEYASWRDLLVRALREKSDYDYKGVEASANDARRWLRDAERFLAAVRKILGSAS